MQLKTAMKNKPDLICTNFIIFTLVLQIAEICENFLAFTINGAYNYCRFLSNVCTS